MGLEDIFPIIMALVLAVGLPLALLGRKKRGQKKLDELLLHLRRIGAKASPADKDSDQEKMGPRRSWGEKSEGVIKLEGRNIDSINLVGVSSQYGTNYYLEYVVMSPRPMETAATKKTTMVRRKSPPLWGKVMDIEWRGDPRLSQRLNFDYQLKYGLLQGGLNTLKGGISILPEPKYGYVRIRTAYQPPGPDLFEVIDTIAKHVKSWA